MLDEDLVPTPFFTLSSQEHVLMGFFPTIDALWAGGFEFFLLGFLVPSTSFSNSSTFEGYLPSKKIEIWLTSP